MQLINRFNTTGLSAFSYARYTPSDYLAAKDVHDVIVEDMNRRARPISDALLVGTGASGMFVATAIRSYSSMTMKYLHIRKSGEYAHTSSPGHENLVGNEVIYIVDDLVASGITVARILEALNDIKKRLTVNIVIPGLQKGKRFEEVASSLGMTIDKYYH